MTTAKELAAQVFVLWADLDQEIVKLTALRNRLYRLWAELDRRAKEAAEYDA